MKALMSQKTEPAKEQLPEGKDPPKPPGEITKAQAEELAALAATPEGRSALLTALLADQLPGQATPLTPAEQGAALAQLAATCPGRTSLLALLSGYKLPTPPAGRELTELLRGLKLPSPNQLAALAATVGPRDRPDDAVRCALRFSIQATAFLNKHRTDPLTELALAIGDHDLFLAAYAAQKTGPPLLLEMDKKNDAVRRYLREHGISLEKAKSVRENLRDSLRYTDMLVFLCSTKHQPPLPQGPLANKAHQEAVERQARDAGWNKSDSDLLAIVAEKRTDNREVYLVPQAMLDCLVAYKKGRKHSGGVKSRQTAAAKESSEKVSNAY